MDEKYHWWLDRDCIESIDCFGSLLFNMLSRLVRGFSGGSEVKASACNVGDLGSIPGSGRFLWRRKWQPTPVFLPGESHGQRSLVGYSPRGRKELDTTERLHCHFHFRLVIAFLLRSKHLSISWLQSPSAVILEPRKIKSAMVSIVFHQFAMK